MFSRFIVKGMLVPTAVFNYAVKPNIEILIAVIYIYIFYIKFNQKTILNFNSTKP